MKAVAQASSLCREKTGKMPVLRWIDPRDMRVHVYRAFGGPVSTAVVLLAGLAMISPAARVAADEAAGDDRRSMRRTPVVEVFETWQDSVVFVTGPVISSGPPPLDEFFDLPSKKRETSVGGGFVIHQSGYILTNAHATVKVLDHKVTLLNSKSYPAELVALVPEDDLALLKIDAEGPLHAVRLAPADDLLIGETVVAIGHPHGLRFTCTAGVLSARGRSTNLLDMKGLRLQNLIQCDAGINPGSSGGPWLNILGEVIGITASMKKNAENIAFAVPAATIRRQLPQMLDVQRRYGFTTGLTLSPAGPARITAVDADSAAAKAGIQVGDVLTKLGDEPIPSVMEYHLTLIGRAEGEILPIELTRQGEPVKASLELGERSPPDTAALLSQKLGLTAAPLSEETAKQMLLKSARGVLITDVDVQRYESVEHQPAAGDVLARIDKIRPRDSHHLGVMLEKLKPGRKVSIVLLRRRGDDATRIDISVTLPP